MPTAADVWLLYDGDCRICTAFARWVDAIDVRGRIARRPLQDSHGLLPNLPGDEILDAVRVVRPDGRIAEGPDALVALLAAVLDGDVLEALLRRSRLALRGAQRLYAILVAFRGHLTCRMPPAPGPAPAR